MLILFQKNLQKQHFVVLLPSLGNKQQKVNKNIFQKGPMFFFQNFIKINDFISIFFFFSFNFILIKKMISYLFNVHCRLIFDPGEK